MQEARLSQMAHESLDNAFRDQYFLERVARDLEGLEQGKKLPGKAAWLMLIV